MESHNGFPVVTSVTEHLVYEVRPGCSRRERFLPFYGPNAPPLCGRTTTCGFVSRSSCIVFPNPGPSSAVRDQQFLSLYFGGEETTIHAPTDRNHCREAWCTHTARQCEGAREQTVSGQDNDTRLIRACSEPCTSVFSTLSDIYCISSHTCLMWETQMSI